MPAFNASPSESFAPGKFPNIFGDLHRTKMWTHIEHPPSSTLRRDRELREEKSKGQR
jgi:hypothetical protein